MTTLLSVLQPRASTRLLTAVTQPLQQQGDLMLQDVEDELLDIGPLKASSPQEPHALTCTSQQQQPFRAHRCMTPIKHSEVKQGMHAILAWLSPWC